MKNNKGIIDLFCGCGGLSYGFEKAGFEIELAIDSWKDAVETYNHNHLKKVAKCIDIHELSNNFLEKIKKNIIGIIGGPPCQGFSTVGSRNINDSRNHLYLEYCRVVEIVKPEFFIIENVKGLLTLGNGIFKNDIINRFSKLGYKVEFKILNAADYGIPQNRHRVFFVGLRNKKFVFPDISEKKISSSDAISDLPSLKYENKTKYISDSMNEYQKEMRGKNIEILNHEKTNHIQQTVDIIKMIPDGGKITDLSKEYWNIRKYNKAFQRMNSNKPSNTIDTGHRNYFHYKYDRIPTVRESARIQSFPDNFEFLGSKTSQYKQVGNAVPPKLSYIIAKKIRDMLKED